ncbi:hypothetical protein V8F20_008188 [Naviculisporaceae sp. PSN 640]
MSSEVSLLPRDSESTPTTVIQLRYEEPAGDQNGSITHEKSPLSWIKRCKHDVFSDLRSAQWKNFGKAYLLGIWVFFLIILATTLPACLYLIGIGYASYFAHYGLEPAGCLPNDAFNARSMDYNIFDPSGLFQITHGFGTLSFTEAKVIDLIWDIGVGRVGQTVLAFYSWRAFTAYFTVDMGAKSVTYGTFWAIFLDRQPSFLDIFHVVKDFINHQTRRSKSAIIFIPFSMSFVLVFPTLISAMTGYRPNNAAFVRDSANSLVPFENFTLAAYVIHDGLRVNLANDYIVPFVAGLGLADLPRDAKQRTDLGAFDITDDASYTVASMFVCAKQYPERCYLSYNVSKYVEQWGFYGLDAKTGKPNEIETTFMGTRLKPALNISAFYLPAKPIYDRRFDKIETFYGHDWVDPRTKAKPFANASNLALYVEGGRQAYSLDYVQQNGSCKQQNSYQWGFSFLQIFFMAVLLLIWTTGTYSLGYGAHKILEGQQQSEVYREIPSEYKAALAFVSTLHTEMAAAGKERPESLTNKQLKDCIRTDLGGGRILAPAPSKSARRYSVLRSLWKLVRQHPFLFPTFVLMSGYMTTWVLFPISYAVLGIAFVFFIHTGFVFALAIGRTNRSRAIFAWAGILAMLMIMVLWFGITFAVA